MKIPAKCCCLVLFVIIGQMSLADSSSVLSQSRWRISYLNGYPIYSDIVYRSSTFVGEPSWTRGEKIERMLVTAFAIPQLSISYINPKSKFHFTAETRISPVTNLYMTDGQYPKPIERDEIALNLMVGKSLVTSRFNHLFFVGLSGRYLGTHIILWPDQDVFSHRYDQINLEPGLILKYEITKFLDKKQRIEIGLGFNKVFYASKINVTNIGLVLAYRFGTPP